METQSSASQTKYDCPKGRPRTDYRETSDLQGMPILASAAVPFLIQVDVDGIGEITAVFLALFLEKRLSRNDLKGLLDVDALLCAGLEVGHLSATLAIGVGSLLSNHSSIFAQVNLVPQHNKREAFRVTRAGLDQEFVTPGIEVLKRLCRVDIIDQHAAVGASVECDAE